MEADSSGEMLEYYSDLAALGTIADVVPLKAENRCIVRHGLESLQHTQNAGLAALLSACGLADKPVTASSIAFLLAPRINAAGRLGMWKSCGAAFVAKKKRVQLALAEEICRL